MKRIIFFCLALVASLDARSIECGQAEPVYPEVLFPTVVMETSAGTIVLELDRRRAPVTVNNFLRYLQDGRYEGTLFHRVVEGFVVQGGGYGKDLRPVETFGEICNESGNGLANARGTIAMARHDPPHSASSQFYFNLADNDSLDPNRRSWGYTVFGQVIEGLEVLDRIGGAGTGYSAQLDATDVPVTPVILHRAQLRTD